MTAEGWIQLDVRPAIARLLLTIGGAGVALGCGARSELDAACIDEACRRTEARQSCEKLHAFDPKLPSGAYQLTDGGVTFLDYCDMTTDGGGFTLVLKADGRKPTFAFDAAPWSNGEPFGDATADLSLVEAEFQSYGLVSFREIRIVLASPEDGSDAHAVTASLEARSLEDAIAAGFTPLDVPRAHWLALVPGAELQNNCNQSGVDADGTGTDSSAAHIRLGIVANQEDDCRTPDSFVGVGAMDSPSEDGKPTPTFVTSGAFCASFWCTPGPALQLPRFAFVFVR